MHSSRSTSARNFLCAGRAGFPEILQNFRAVKISRKICVISTLDSRVILHSNARRLGKELQRSSAVRATTLAEFTQLLCARRAKIFRDLGNFFARVGRKICVIPTLDAFAFGSECNADSTNSISDVVKYAQRTLAECTQFCARGVPDFRKFCNFFARFFSQNLRRLDAGLARYLALERTPTRKRAATKFCGSRNHAGRVHATFARAARRNFSETLKFHSREFGAKVL